MAKPRRAAVYARLSRHREDEQSASTKRQVEACRKLAAERGWDVVAEYVDDDRSAYSGKRRPGYDDLLGAIDAGAVDVVIAWAADRLHRRPAELESFVDLIDESGVEVATVQSGRVDLSTPAGRAQARMLGAMAAYESEHRSARTRAAHDQIAAEGRWKGGRRPYGYRPGADGSMTIDKDERKVIREAARRIVKGERVGTIAADFERRGLPTVTGARWRTATLRRIVTSPTVAGRRVSKGEDVGPARWPAILTPEELAEVVNVLSMGPKRGRVARVALLSGGRVRCGECDAPMRSARRDTGRRIYRCLECFQQVAADPLDDAIAEAVVETLDKARLPKAGRKRTDDLEAIQRDLDALADDYGAGRISRREWLAAREPLTSRLDSALAERAKAVGSPTVVRLTGRGKASSAWPNLSLEQRQSVVDALIARVVIRRSSRRGPGLDVDRIGIDWRA